MITTLRDLYKELDALYLAIEKNCSDCHMPDCMGYVWILRDERASLLERQVPLVEVNRGPTFIHSFATNDDGTLKLDQRYPLCRFRSGMWCSIHDGRPLVCRLYPVGLETTQDGVVVWVVHRDCLHVQKLETAGALDAFQARARSIIDRLSPELADNILNTYHMVDRIAVFPDGERNNFSILCDANCQQSTTIRGQNHK